MHGSDDKVVEIGCLVEPALTGGVDRQRNSRACFPARRVDAYTKCPFE